MSWDYIYRLLGPGLHWFKSQAHFRKAVSRAEADGQTDAAEHIRIIWQLRNDVMMEPLQAEEKDPGAGPGSNSRVSS
jgi:hypothetical protein